MNNFKVVIQNTINSNLKWEAYFSTLQEAEAWRDEQVLKIGRNTVAGWFKESELSTDRKNSATDERYVESGLGIYYKEMLVPAEATVEITDLTEYLAKIENLKQKKLIGTVLRQLSQSILDIITGHLATSGLTTDQVSQLKLDFTDIYYYLSENMPLSAKSLLDDVVPDGVIVTQAIIDDILLEYEEYKKTYPSIIVF